MGHRSETMETRMVGPSQTMNHDCQYMMVRLISSLLAICVAVVLLGASAAQAAIAMSCDTVVAGATDCQHLSGTGPHSMPGNDKLPGCTGMLGCGLSASLPGRVAATTRQTMWTSAAYWPVADWHDGLSIKPELGPPITIGPSGAFRAQTVRM
jgi:hypothetical protein